MAQAIVSAVSGILSYFLGIFGSDKLFYPGFDEPFLAWKVLFAFLAAASVFLSQLKTGLIGVFGVGIIAAIGLGLNYQAQHAFPPIGSPTDMSWFCYQIAQSCFVGIGVRLAATLAKVLPKSEG